MTPTQLVSIHGGHSGQFCSHASDTLQEVVQAYIRKGFAWVGITEHMPPAAPRFIYDEEREAGFTCDALMDRFHRYMIEVRRLQKKYAGDMQIYVGFETEAHPGAMALAQKLIRQYRPDYVLGGIHHVADIPFDSGADQYQNAVAACGGIEALYCRYFDLQYELIQTLRPKVLAHFDLIRIFDDHYRQRWQVPAIADRIERNLDRVKELNLILDYNVAALRKGADEPYLAKVILEKAGDKGIAVVPGDDSHGCRMVGAYIEEGIAILEDLGISTQWPKPVASAHQREMGP